MKSRRSSKAALTTRLVQWNMLTFENLELSIHRIFWLHSLSVMIRRIWSFSPSTRTDSKHYFICSIKQVSIWHWPVHRRQVVILRYTDGFVVTPQTSTRYWTRNGLPPRDYELLSSSGHSQQLPCYGKCVETAGQSGIGPVTFTKTSRSRSCTVDVNRLHSR